MTVFLILLGLVVLGGVFIAGALFAEMHSTIGTATGNARLSKSCTPCSRANG